MTKKVIAFYVFFFLCWLLAPGSSFGDSPGTSGARVLNLAVGARSLAMGEAFVAVADDVDTIFWNPAGLAHLQRRELSAMYLRGLAGVNSYYLGLGYPYGRRGVFGAGLGILRAGQMQINYPDGNSENVLSQQDLLFLLAHGRELDRYVRYLSCGASLKFLQSSLVQKYKATTIALDMGILYRIPVLNLTAGLSMQNLGFPMKYRDKGDPLPLKLRTGLSYKTTVMARYFLGSMDLLVTRKEGIKEHLGFEYSVVEGLVFRMGYKFGYDLDSLTAGIGVLFERYRIDYGLAVMSAMNWTHRLSTVIRF